MRRSLWFAVALLTMISIPARADSFIPTFTPTCDDNFVCLVPQTVPDAKIPSTKLIFTFGSLILNRKALSASDADEWTASSDLATDDPRLLAFVHTGAFGFDYDELQTSQGSGDTTGFGARFWAFPYFPGFGLGTSVSTSPATEDAATVTITDTPSVTAEPASLALLPLGLGALLLMRKPMIRPLSPAV